MPTPYLSWSTISFPLYHSPLQDLLQTDLDNCHCTNILWSLLKAQWESMPFYLKVYYELCSPCIFSWWGPKPLTAYLNWLSFELCQTAEQPWFTWSPTTTDLMAAREIEKQPSVTADIKARMPHLDPGFTLPAGANWLTWPPWEFKGANVHRHTNPNHSNLKMKIEV